MGRLDRTLPANWIGNGRILVPISGLRLAGMTMAAHQGAEGPTIYTLSIFPNPLTTFATITAGSMGMGFREFLVANFAGHVNLALFGQWLLGA